MSLVVPQVYCWGMYLATEVSPFSANRFNTGSPEDSDGYLQHRQGSKLLELGYKSDFLDYGEHGEAMGSAKTPFKSIISLRSVQEVWTRLIKGTGNFDILNHFCCK